MFIGDSIYDEDFCILEFIPKMHADLCDKILNCAMKEFAIHGIVAVRMDDVAAKLSISKRTLYETFSNKEELLMAGILRHEHRMLKYMQVVTEQGENVMEIVMKFYHYKVEEFRHTNPKFYEDIDKYPRVKQYLSNKGDKHREKSLEFFNKGVKQGLFRKDVNYRIVNIMLEVQITYLMSTDVHKQFSYADMFESITMVEMRGVCTTKGMHCLERLLERIKTESFDCPPGLFLNE